MNFGSFFSFSPGEKRGLLVLFVFLACLFTFRYGLLPRWSAGPDSLIDYRLITSQLALWEQQDQAKKVLYSSFKVNQARLEDWLRLGLDSACSRRILQYKKRHGDFENIDSLKKVWALPEKEAEWLAYSDFSASQVEDYQLVDINLASAQDFYELGFSRETSQKIVSVRKQLGAFSSKKQLLSALPYCQKELQDKWTLLKCMNQGKVHALPKDKEDINLADSSQLVDVKGIGPAFARRILQYRDKLGGFYSMEQLKEVYGLADNAFALAQLNASYWADSARVKKIHLHGKSPKRMPYHPYLVKEDWPLLYAHIPYAAAEGLQGLARRSQVPLERLKRCSPYFCFACDL